MNYAREVLICDWRSPTAIAHHSCLPPPAIGRGTVVWMGKNLRSRSTALIELQNHKECQWELLCISLSSGNYFRGVAEQLHYSATVIIHTRQEHCDGADFCTPLTTLIKLRMKPTSSDLSDAFFQSRPSWGRLAGLGGILASGEHAKRAADSQFSQLLCHASEAKRLQSRPSGLAAAGDNLS